MACATASSATPGANRPDQRCGVTRRSIDRAAPARAEADAASRSCILQMPFARRVAVMLAERDRRTPEDVEHRRSANRRAIATAPARALSAADRQTDSPLSAAVGRCCRDLRGRRRQREKFARSRARRSESSDAARMAMHQRRRDALLPGIGWFQGVCHRLVNHESATSICCAPSVVARRRPIARLREAELRVEAFHGTIAAIGREFR